MSESDQNPWADAHLEERFDTTFVSELALPEKQIQQSYRPIIGVHKWFARRPGTLFRSLILAEFGCGPLRSEFWRAHDLRGTIADPFMGGGTPLIEANRLGFDVVGCDVNPMAYWIVRQALVQLDVATFRAAADAVASDVEAVLGDMYQTRCSQCGDLAAVKYFIWVKTLACPACGRENDLFPGYMLAEDARHPLHVYHCSACKQLTEVPQRISLDAPARCAHCSALLKHDGPARRNKVTCACGVAHRYPEPDRLGVPNHRMWAIEYQCLACKPTHRGRFFKTPDADDYARVVGAEQALHEQIEHLPIPSDEVPAGDETTRLHRWGYRRYRDMFTARQLLGLGTLLRRVQQVPAAEIRNALLTVFSDSLRYQNLLCRYDTMALKCQDIFSVHGFPVGLVQCENSLLGTAGVGSGSFRHFVEKYARAKEYCLRPFETRGSGSRKRVVTVEGESIGASVGSAGAIGTRKRAHLHCAPAASVAIEPGSLDAVFTDPPYFDNVQYAELMDFCYVWLRRALRRDSSAFTSLSTRTEHELTGNITFRRDLAHFSAGLSSVFRQFARGLKASAPFVFTYHHNDLMAYVPIATALLDSGLACTRVLAAPAEMEASLHINGTGSSVVDSVFVCRVQAPVMGSFMDVARQLEDDVLALRAGGVRVTRGDLRCLVLGHATRIVIGRRADDWDSSLPTARRMEVAELELKAVLKELDAGALVEHVLGLAPSKPKQLELIDG